MDNQPAYRIALLSVHAEYADALVTGQKTVEFRKRPLAPDVTHVALYATHPVARVVAVFTVREQVIDSPQRLWRQFSKVAGISKVKFLDYYDGCSRGVGIRVGDLVSLDRHVTLQEAFGISRPPQSFQYFGPHQAGSRLAEIFS
ncbi:ASCH domain-containing protein [Mycobacterium sp. 2YAF39]|uniref:ASCH domain-containing protein n=1 Tax=Mycobacterium sp. 2YAF39 TaxID=3233033 RepID=UPI003F95F7A6